MHARGGGESQPAAGQRPWRWASGKTSYFCGLMTTKGSGPGKTLCDTEEMSVDLRLGGEAAGWVRNGKLPL